MADDETTLPDEPTRMRGRPRAAAVTQGQAPTLDDAFRCLAQAVDAAAVDDLAVQLAAQEVQVWYDDGNHAASWKRLIVLLEGVLNVPLRQS